MLCLEEVQSTADEALKQLKHFEAAVERDRAMADQLEVCRGGRPLNTCSVLIVV